jgi:hypothetical protein
VSAPLIEVLHAFAELIVHESVYNSLVTPRKMIPIKCSQSVSPSFILILSPMYALVSQIFYYLADFQLNLCKYFVSSVCATYNECVIVLDLNTLIIIVVIGEDTDYEASNTVCPMYDDPEYGSCCGVAW